VSSFLQSPLHLSRKHPATCLPYSR
jgi:hypothetical protein